MLRRLLSQSWHYSVSASSEKGKIACKRSLVSTTTKLRAVLLPLTLSVARTRERRQKFYGQAVFCHLVRARHRCSLLLAFPFTGGPSVQTQRPDGYLSGLSHLSNYLVQDNCPASSWVVRPTPMRRAMMSFWTSAVPPGCTAMMPERCCASA